jgi:hypothetical protein
MARQPTAAEDVERGALDEADDGLQQKFLSTCCAIHSKGAYHFNY